MRKIMLLLCVGFFVVACKDPTIKVEPIKVETIEKMTAKNVVDSLKSLEPQQVADFKFFENQQIFETPDSFYVALEKVEDSVYFAVGYTSVAVNDLQIFIESENGVPLYNLAPCKATEKLYESDDKVCSGKIQVSEMLWNKTLKGFAGYVGKNQGRVERKTSIVNRGEKEVYNKRISSAVASILEGGNLPPEAFDENGKLNKFGKDILKANQQINDWYELGTLKRKSDAKEMEGGIERSPSSSGNPSKVMSAKEWLENRRKAKAIERSNHSNGERKYTRESWDNF